MAHVNTWQKNNKIKNTKIKIKCVGGVGNLLYLLCLISNTLPQWEQSSLHPSTVLQHRHLLQTTSYNHLLLLHHLISRKGKKTSSNRLGTPLSWRVEKPEGPSALQPTAEALPCDSDKFTSSVPIGIKVSIFLFNMVGGTGSPGSILFHMIKLFAGSHL